MLKALLEAIPVEAADIMLQLDNHEAPMVAEYRLLLPPGVDVRGLPRFEFYEAAKSPDTGLVIATGEQRQYANLLLLVSVITADGTAKF